MPQKHYALFGAKAELPSWVQTIEEDPRAFNIKGYGDLFGCSSVPLRYPNQVPARWKTEDPGFPVLLRDFPERPFPEWIFTPDEYDFAPRSQVKKSETIIIIAHHQKDFPTWDELNGKFENKKLIWTYYQCPSAPSWPRERFKDYRECLFEITPEPDSFFDINYWQNETLGPLHAHLLHQGATSLNLRNHDDNWKFKVSRYYGEWRFKKNHAIF